MSNRALTIQEKLSMIDYFEKERPELQDLADRFNVAKIQAAKIIEKREYIRNNGHKEQTVVSKRKEFFSPQGKIIDVACYEWYLDCIKKQKPVSGKLIKEKAIKVARSIQHKGFCASNGWLQKWRARHKLTGKTQSDNTSESSTVEKQAAFTSIPEKVNAKTNNLKRTAQNIIKKKKFGVKLPLISKKPKKSLYKSNFEEDFDPLSLSAVSYGDNDSQNTVNDDGDDVISESENENRFKINCYTSALNAIEDLKNFAQDDDNALMLLNKIESHFKKERLK